MAPKTEQNSIKNDTKMRKKTTPFLIGPGVDFIDFCYKIGGGMEEKSNSKSRETSEGSKKC